MFRKELPRIYELVDLIENPDSPHSCFRDFKRVLKDPEAIKIWLSIENDLRGLDGPAWEFLKKEASKYLTKWNEKSKHNGAPRGREPLLNILYQAKAYNFLKSKGYSDIHFVQPSKRNGIKSPDLQGTSDTGKVLCEVKTINRSEDEVYRNLNGEYLHKNFKLESAFFEKLRTRLEDAKKQMEAHDPGNEAKRIIYIILNLDDFWGDHKEDSIQRIDEYLSCSENRVPGTELVFHGLRTTFNNTVTMKYATFVTE